MYRQIKRDLYWNQVRQLCLTLIKSYNKENESALNDISDKIIDKNGLDVDKSGSLHEKTKAILSIAEKRIGTEK
jgi:hypothetical protein